MITEQEATPVTGFMLSRVKRKPALGGNLFIVLAGAALFVLLLVLIGHINVNRMQENIYLGIPFSDLVADNFHVRGADPWEENGFHTLVVPAAILLKSGSFLLMRTYLALFAALGLIGVLTLTVRRTKTEIFSTATGKISLAVMAVSLWISIPLAATYALQVNGMSIGFLFIVFGLLYVEKNLRLAAFLFGCAAFSKGQYLAFFLPMMGFLFIDRMKASGALSAKVKLLAGDALAYFAVHLVFCYFVLAFEWVNHSVDYVGYVIMPFKIIFNALIGVMTDPSTSVAAITVAEPVQHHSLLGYFSSRLTATEFKDYGFISWLQIGISFAGCLWGFAGALWAAVRRRPLNRVDGLLGFAGLAYWLHFLFLWAYPYWYNGLALLAFNIYFVARAMDWAYQHRPLMVTPALVRWGQVGLMVFFLLLLANRMRFYGVLKGGEGNFAETYQWQFGGSVI